MAQENLYDKFGGREGIEKVVEVFYECILADPTVNHFFDHTDMEKQKRHQTLFISYALGGPNQYSGRSMAKAHEGLNLQPKHFTAIVNHLDYALAHHGVSKEDRGKVLEKINSLKDDVLYK